MILEFKSASSEMNRFDLERWQATFSNNHSRIVLIVRQNSGKHGSLRPFEGAWSVAECFHHLVKTTEAYLPLWSEAMASPDHHFGSDYPFWWRWFIRGMEDPRKMRSQTAAAFVPDSTIPLEEVIEQYLDQREQVKRAAEEMFSGDVGGVKIQSLLLHG